MLGRSRLLGPLRQVLWPTGIWTMSRWYGGSDLFFLRQRFGSGYRIGLTPLLGVGALEGRYVSVGQFDWFESPMHHFWHNTQPYP